MFSKKSEPREKHYTVPADVNVALLHTIIAITALRDVLLKEIDALKAGQGNIFMDLQDEKVEVARRYELLVTNLMSRGSEIKKADAKLKSQLERLQGDFGQVAKDNLYWIERMKNATERLTDTIMSGARKSAEGKTQFAYGASGKMQKGNKALIGLDERA